MRIVRGLGALTVLLLGLVGVPAALVQLAGSPIPRQLSWVAVRRVLLSPDDGSMLMGLIALIAWLAWLVFAAAVLSELVTVLSHQRLQVRLPALAGTQRLVAGLILTVLALVSMPTVGHSEPIGSPAPQTPAEEDRFTSATGEAVTTRSVEAPLTAGDTGERTEDQGSVRHKVVRGDDLWSLAERYYGHGREWRRIAVANADRLTGGPDRLEPGWVLRIPDVKSTPGDSTPQVEVEDGDTLSSIAADLYGDADRWPELYAANRAQLHDPDHLQAGMRLDRPDEADPASIRRGDSAAGDESAPRDGSPDRSEESSRGRTAEDRPVERKPSPSAPTTPSASAPSASAPPASAPAPPTEGRRDTPAVPGASDDSAESATAVGLSAVGGLLAAGVISGLAVRRRIQLQRRPLGRRILHPDHASQVLESALGHKQRPLSLRTLDLATRAVAAHCRHTATPLPSLQLATVADDRIELIMEETAAEVPVGFTLEESHWRLDPADVGYLRSLPGVGEAPRPYPTLVTLGRDRSGAQQLVDLESVGLLCLRSASRDVIEASFAAVVVELANSAWADEMILTLVGTCAGLPEALGRHNVTRAEDLDEVLTRVEQRAAVQRQQDPDGHGRQRRVDPNLADPWVPEVLLVNAELSPDQCRRILDLTTAAPRVTMAAVVAGNVPSARWVLDLDAAVESGAASETGVSATDAPARTAELQPVGLMLSPQLLERPAADALIQLFACTGSEQTDVAPWWTPPTESPPVELGSNVRFLAGREDASGAYRPTDDHDLIGTGRWTEMEAEAAAVSHGPVLLLLGPVELVGAAGSVPPRAGRQCLEYCGWLLEHPRSTAQEMTSALLVAEGTRRSNMSRLRTWLGADPDGQAYLPDAYTGRISLLPTVSSDWIHLRILTAAGVPNSSTQALRTALQLVRGGPLADAAPGQWHWAEELRTDMISAVRDIGVELATRALADHDIDLARWAAARALVVAPGDELLMRTRISTEHQAGNRAEVGRLTLQLAAQARSLGVDLDPETVLLLQEMMEGQVRARLA